MTPTRSSGSESLGYDVSLLDILFDRMPMGIMVLDRDFRIRRWNPTWAEFIDRYTQSSAEDVVEGVSLFDLAPGTEERTRAIFHRVLRGEVVRQDALPMESGGILSYWDVVWSPLYEDGEVVGLVDVTTDATERVEAERRRLVAEGLRGIMGILNSNQPLDEVLGYLARQACRMMNANASIIHHVERDKDRVTIEASYGLPIPKEHRTLHTKIYDGYADRAIFDRRPYAIPNLTAYVAELDDGEVEIDDGEVEWRESVRSATRFYNALLAIPLIVGDDVYGSIVFYYEKPQAFAEEDVQLGLALGDQAALAIESARLYAETRRRADELRTLFAVQQAIISRLDPDTVLQMIADEARRLTDTEQSAVYLLDEDELEIAVVSGAVQPEMLHYRLPLENSIAGLAIRTGKSFCIDDAHADDRVHQEVVHSVGARSFVIVPLMSGSEAIGTITVANKRDEPLGEDDERVLSMMASSAVIGLENARHYQQELERRRVAEGLRDMVALLNSNYPLDELLDRLIEQAARLLEADAGILFRIDAERRTLEAASACGMPELFDDVALMPFLDTEPNRAMVRGEPFAVPNVQAHFARHDVEAILREAPALRPWVESIRDHFSAYLSIPLVIKGELYGAISLYYHEPHPFSPGDVTLAVTFCDQVALALENARLRARAEQAAVAAERSRLARELHDAVTQTLFSASLIAEVIPRLWEINQEEGVRRLGELRELTRGALAEMRTLLLELRPTVLEEAKMVDLLNQLAEAIIGRARIQVNVAAEGACTLPADEKVAFYRIAQEALNNVAKHANASQADVRLHCGADVVELSIKDNGRGFDLSRVPPNHLGLGIMQERAEAIGAEIRIVSAEGQGTCITVMWPREQ